MAIWSTKIDWEFGIYNSIYAGINIVDIKKTHQNIDEF